MQGKHFTSQYSLQRSLEFFSVERDNVLESLGGEDSSIHTVHKPTLSFVSPELPNEVIVAMQVGDSSFFWKLLPFIVMLQVAPVIPPTERM